MAIALDGTSLTVADLVTVARSGAEVALTGAARDRVAEGRERVAHLLDRDEPVYGVNTGVGSLRETRIKLDQVRDLQMNLLRSHAAGVGPPLPAEVVRATMALKANAFARGLSGVRPKVVELLLAMLNEGVHPAVPERGSVGASGDLVPLAHIGLVLVGEGEVLVDGGGEGGEGGDGNGARPATLPGGEALADAGLDPLEPEAKEGLSLINGTEPTLALLALNLHDAEALVKAAVLAGAMSLEALMASVQPMRDIVVGKRPHPGAARVADAVRRLTAASEVVASHAECDRVQDAYSVRCIPQVLGAVLDALDYVRTTVARELGSVTDNPLILPEAPDQSATGGNFHGQPLGYAADHLALVLADLASMAERRVARLVDEDLSEGLPAFLTDEPGIRSGMMIPQYVAAALVSESKTLAYPASVDSIPTSANQEDHVAMSTIAARKARKVLDNAQAVVAIELIAAAEALDHKDPLTPGKGSAAARRFLREEAGVAPLDGDRSLRPDIERVRGLLQTGDLVRAVEAEVGALLREG